VSKRSKAVRKKKGKGNAYGLHNYMEGTILSLLNYRGGSKTDKDSGQEIEAGEQVFGVYSLIWAL